MDTYQARSSEASLRSGPPSIALRVLVRAALWEACLGSCLQACPLRTKARRAFLVLLPSPSHHHHLSLSLRTANLLFSHSKDECHDAGQQSDPGDDQVTTLLSIRPLNSKQRKSPSGPKYSHPHRHGQHNEREVLRFLSSRPAHFFHLSPRLPK